MNANFRVFDAKQNKVFYEGYSIDCQGDLGHFSNHNKGKWNPLDSIVMFSTKLKDKNGKEIYEGDIVSYYDNWGMPTQQKVIFANGRFIPLVRIEYGYNAIEDYDPKDFEVIGDIYSNPELL